MTPLIRNHEVSPETAVAIRAFDGLASATFDSP